VGEEPFLLIEDVLYPFRDLGEERIVSGRGRRIKGRVWESGSYGKGTQFFVEGKLGQVIKP